MTHRSRRSLRTAVAIALAAATGACAPDSMPGFARDGGARDGFQASASNPDGGGGTTQSGCIAGDHGCYTVYAHSDHVLYKLDLVNKQLVEVGPFNAPMVQGSNGMQYEDVITDLAVAPDDTVYVISHTRIYTADAKDGHVTQLGHVTNCGVMAVALSFDTDGTLYAGDFAGAFCKIDLTTMPPTVSQIATIGDGLALSGDIVVVGDGTMYGTAYKLSDGNNGATAENNLLVKLDPRSGQATVMGPSGFPRLYGTAFDQGQVFGFTHTGSGEVVTIDPKTGQGTPYATFTDPSTGMGITFAGAGVNPMVSPSIM